MEKKQPQPLLRKVVDNGVSNHIKPLRAIVEEKYLQAHQLELQKQKRLHLKIGGLALLIFGSSLYISINQVSLANQPKEMILVEADYNKDGVSDAYIIDEGKHKTPMYGVRSPDGVIGYVSAKDMERNDSLINYDSIEEKLNKH